MIDESDLNMENEDYLNMKDPLDTANETDIKIEKVQDGDEKQLILTHTSNDRNLTNDIAASKVLLVELQTVKVKEEYDEEVMVDESYFTSENEDNLLDVKDPLAIAEETEIKIEGGDVNQSVIQKSVLEKDVPVSTQSWHEISGKHKKVMNESGVLKHGECCTDVSDNQLRENRIVHKSSLYTSKNIVLTSSSHADNDGSESGALIGNSDITSNSVHVKLEEEVGKPGELLVTKRSRSREKPFMCNICEKSFTMLINLKNHELLHSGEKRFVCDVCEKSFNYLSDLSLHIRTHTGEKPFVCNVCVKSFARLAHLKRHRQIHTGERPFVCDICGKSFAYLNVLNVHKRIHSGDKPFVCNVCEKPFARSCDLNVHKQTHSVEKPFACDICKKSFTLFDYLRKHKLLHNGDKPFVCDICEKTFASLRDLKVHKRTHTGEKPFVCNVCEKPFTYLNVLKIHKRTHTGEKPFECNVCKKAFAQLGHLNKHKVTHTGEKRFVCDICKKLFTRLDNLKEHKRTRHTGGYQFVGNFLEKDISVQ